MHDGNGLSFDESKSQEPGYSAPFFICCIQFRFVPFKNLKPLIFGVPAGLLLLQVCNPPPPPGLLAFGSH